MEREDKRVKGSIAAGASLVLLLSVSSGWAGPIPQVLKGSTPDSATASGQPVQLTPQQLRERIAKKIAMGQPRTSPKMTNPRGGSKALNSSLIGLLRNQKQVADTERSAILASPRGARMAPKVAGAGGPGLAPTHTMSNPVPTDPATGAPLAGKPGATPPAGTPGATPPSNPGTTPPAGTPRGAPTSVGSKGAATGVMRMPASTVVPSSPPPPDPRGAAGLGVAMAICQHPRIDTVNGQTKGAVFTPDPQYNLYTIKGCLFGDTQGQAHLYGAFASGQVALQIEFWSDTQIVAKVDPQVTGELDQDNVSLVVVPSGAPQLQQSGFKFYAIRETTLLTKIPMSAVNFGQVTDSGGHPVSFGAQGPGLYDSPPARPGFAGMSAEVFRGTLYVFPPGQDLFDFSKMKPGFTTDNMQLKYSVLPNNGCDLYMVGGSWNAEWVGDNIRVSWQQQHCHEAPGGMGVGSFDTSLSHYALSVWVSGPRGVNPWPGNLQ